MDGDPRGQAALDGPARNETARDEKGRLSLMIDLERCIGCKSCEVACKQEHGLGRGVYRNRVLWLGDPEGPALDFLTVACQHCTRPACLRACPVNPKAITKDEATGVVAVDPQRCTGCGECVTACPYGAMGYDPIEHHAVKCDLCGDRRAAGKDPACASVCPGHAISFGNHNDLLALARSEGRTPGAHDPYLMGPGTIYLEPFAREADGMEAGATISLAKLAERPSPTLMDGPPDWAGLKDEGTAYPYRAPREERTPDRVEAAGCNICFNCCTTKVHFRGDKVVRIEGNDEDPVLKGKVCPKSQLSVQWYESDKRLTTPLKRVGRRGEAKFEPISWEQALDEIAAKLQKLREEDGPEALGLFSGTRTGIVTNKGYIRLFSQMWGTPNVESTEPYCSVGKNLAYVLTQGRNGCGNSYTETDIGSAEMYLYIGDNQAETRPVYFGMVNDWRIRHGAKMVVVDPRYSATASKADRWYGIRAGTDMALGLAMLHHVFASGLHDEAFLEDNTLGWKEWRDFILEKGYSPGWAAPITDIPAAEIARLAEEMAAADGCMLFGSRGLNQHSNSMQTNRVLMMLCAATGNWGRKGGGYMNMSAALPFEANAPKERRGAYARPKIHTTPTGWLTAMSEGRPYPLKALIACNNPMSLWPDQTRSRKGLQDLELLVHIDLFLNETSAYADYVLPAATGIEKGEIGRANDDRRVVWIDRMVEPPGQAKPDGWIWIELGRRLGYGDVLREEYKDSAVFWDAEMLDNDQARGITQKRLHSVPYRWVRQPVASEDAPEQETLYMAGTTAVGALDGHRFPTKSGRLEFWSEEIEAKFRALGLSGMPEFYSDPEQLIDLPYAEILNDDGDGSVTSPFYGETVNAARGRIAAPTDASPGRKLRAQGFDTELVTGRPQAPHFHSWTHYSWQAQEMWPDLYVQMHPKKAAKHGIEDGQRVSVETSHGKIEARAWITAGIRESAVFVPIGWGERQPFNPWRPVNYLTDHSQRDPLSDQTNLKSYLCRITAA